MMDNILLSRGLMSRYTWAKNLGVERAKGLLLIKKPIQQLPLS